MALKAQFLHSKWLLRIALAPVLGGGVACKQSPSPSPTPAASASAESPASRATEEATQAVRALGVYYPLAFRGNEPLDAFAKCHDEIKGYAALLKCLEAPSTKADANANTLPPAQSFSMACASEIESKSRALVSTTSAFLKAYTDWLRANEKKLRPAMVGKTIGDACEWDWCSTAPDSFPGGSHGGASFANINQIECTKALFQCGSADNECHIGKVAARLGVDPDPDVKRPSSHPNDALLVRATGQRIEPLKR